MNEVEFISKSDSINLDGHMCDVLGTMIHSVMLLDTDLHLKGFDNIERDFEIDFERFILKK